MANLTDIDSQMKDAMRSKDAVRLSVLRLLKSELKNKEIELKTDLAEADIVQVLSRMVKQRQESVDQYTKGGRSDLADKESGEIDVLKEFLPQPLSSEEVAALIQDAIQETGAEGPKGMGLVMKALKEKTAGRVDGKMLADQVKSALNS